MGNLNVTPIAYVPDDKLPEGRIVIPFTVDFTSQLSAEVDLSNYISVRQLSCIKAMYFSWKGVAIDDSVKVFVYGTNQTLIVGSDGSGTQFNGFLPIYTNMPCKMTFTKGNGAVGGVLTCMAFNYDVDPATWVPLVYLGGAVESFNGRTGSVDPEPGDYTAAMVTNAVDSSEPNTYVQSVNGQTGAVEIAAGGVTSFNTRTGAIVPEAGDYSANQVANALDLSNATSQAISGNLEIIGNGTGPALKVDKNAEIDGSLSVQGNVSINSGTGVLAVQDIDSPDLSLAIQLNSGQATFPNAAEFTQGASFGASVSQTGGGINTFADPINCSSTVEGTVLSGTTEVSSPHYLAPNRTPPTVTLGNAAGTGATASVAGNDTRGTITINTGTTPTAGAALLCSVAFNQPFPTAPVAIVCISGAAGSNLNGIQFVVLQNDNTTTQFQIWIMVGATLPASHAGIQLNYIVIG